MISTVVTICSTGSSVKVKPGTTLARFKDALGDRFSLLDAIPQIPIAFERQVIFPAYFPFRVHFGTFRGSRVYLYLTLDTKGTIKIIAHGDDGEQRSWTFFDLREPKLFEPFNFFMHFGDNNLRTRGNKIRYIVYYYFMLAENEGLIDNPQIQWSSSSMLATFCSACRDLEAAGQRGGRGKIHAVSSTTDTTPKASNVSVAASYMQSAHSRPEVTGTSLIVKLIIRSEILAAIDGLSLPSQLPEIVDSETDGNGDAAHQGLSEQQIPPASVIEVQMQSSGPVDHNENVELVQKRVEDIVMDDAQEAEEDVPKPTRDYPGDSGFAYSSAPPAAPRAATPDTKRPVLVVDSPEDLRSRSATIREDAYNNNEVPLRSVPDMTMSSPAPEYLDVRPRSISVISIDSASDVQESQVGARPAPAPSHILFPPRDGMSQPRESIIIDLGSEDEESVIAESPKREIEKTPEVVEVPAPNRQQNRVRGDGELRWPPKKGAKRKVRVSNDDDDDIVEVVDGDAWKKASQTKQAPSPGETWRNWE